MNICEPNGNYIWERIVSNEARFWEYVEKTNASRKNRGLAVEKVVI